MKNLIYIIIYVESQKKTEIAYLNKVFYFVNDFSKNLSSYKLHI